MSGKEFRLWAGGLLPALLLAACATTGGGGSWKTAGVSVSGNIRHETDTAGIVRTGSKAVFRDRKTVIDPSRERYSNTPPYKTAIGTWQIDCSAKTFQLMKLQLTDTAGRVVADYTYGESDMQPRRIVRGSATEQQYRLVCGKPL